MTDFRFKIEQPPTDALAAYSNILRKMKKLGLTVNDIPEHLQQSFLRLHQAAQVEWMNKHGKTNRTL